MNKNFSPVTVRVLSWIVVAMIFFSSLVLALLLLPIVLFAISLLSVALLTIFLIKKFISPKKPPSDDYDIEIYPIIEPNNTDASHTGRGDGIEH